MVFDKERYWERRREGLRGQQPVGYDPDTANPDFRLDTRVTKKAFNKNSKKARKIQKYFDNKQLEVFDEYK